MPHTQHGLWVDAPTPTAHDMYGTHAAHTHSTGCGSMHEHPQHMVCMVHMPHTQQELWVDALNPQHMVCMVHMPHTQHGLWVNTPTPTAHGMYGTHATHTA